MTIRFSHDDWSDPLACPISLHVLNRAHNTHKPETIGGLVESCRVIGLSCLFSFFSFYVASSTADECIYTASMQQNEPPDDVENMSKYPERLEKELSAWRLKQTKLTPLHTQKWGDFLEEMRVTNKLTSKEERPFAAMKQQQQQVPPPPSTPCSLTNCVFCALYTDAKRIKITDARTHLPLIIFIIFNSYQLLT